MVGATAPARRRRIDLGWGRAPAVGTVAAVVAGRIVRTGNSAEDWTVGAAAGLGAVRVSLSIGLVGWRCALRSSIGTTG
ncbi:MAG TPA: hypothetical protein DCE55_21885, partial [Planctomycetaceae bacterium]|nr:hypothetical protein [Planctomycetaceae bacterium]